MEKMEWKCVSFNSVEELLEFIEKYGEKRIKNVYHIGEFSSTKWCCYCYLPVFEKRD